MTQVLPGECHVGLRSPTGSELGQHTASRKVSHRCPLAPRGRRSQGSESGALHQGPAGWELPRPLQPPLIWLRAREAVTSLPFIQPCSETLVSSAPPQLWTPRTPHLQHPAAHLPTPAFPGFPRLPLQAQLPASRTPRMPLHPLHVHDATAGQLRGKLATFPVRGREKLNLSSKGYFLSLPPAK